MGFWSVFGIVVGSQIGSGIFMLPSSLAPYGFLSLFSWLISGTGAICLALVFAGLCNRFPQTGGPHVYVQAVFGNTMAFFSGWTYWVISWVSSTAVVITSIGYLSPFISHSPTLNAMLEIALLGALTILNLRGIATAGTIEFILTLLKIIPLIVFPLCALTHFQAAHFIVDPLIQQLPLSTQLAQATLLTLWCFIGLESATTPAGAVKNPSKTIPKAIVIGTVSTIVIYLSNSIGLLGTLPSPVLSASKAPYVDVIQHLFGGDWHILVCVIAFIVCVGTLNAWMLTSGQIALGLAEQGLLPSVFGIKNKNQAPYFSLIISGVGILPFLVCNLNKTMSEQINQIINFSVSTFLFIYLICILAYLKILKKEKRGLAGIWHWSYSLFALFFCCWTISETPLSNLLISAFFVLTGLPMYYYWRKTKP